MKKYILAVIMLVTLSNVSFSETIPDKPINYFNDYTGNVPPFRAALLNKQLVQFERDTSNQFLVVVYPNMNTESSLEDYTQRIFHKWEVGQAGKNNGVVLFVFMKSSNGGGKMRLQTGYGLEGALPDATCSSILNEGIKPYFKQKQYAEGLSEGISRVIKATSQEYKGDGKVVSEKPKENFNGIFIAFFITIFGTLIAIIAFVIHLKRNRQKESEREESERSASCPIFLPIKSSKKRTAARRTYMPIPVPIPVSEPSRHEDEEESRSSYGSSDSSSSSSESDSSPSFDSGGGDSGGGGASSDF